MLASMVSTVGDYRADEGLALMTPEHIHKWVSQFDGEVQIPILREMDHVLKKTYCSKSAVQNFFADEIIQKPEIVGGNPRDFWQRTRLLDIQQRGHSQKEILSLFRRETPKRHGFTPGSHAADDAFVYLDDGLFTGKLAGDDLSAWIGEYAPARGVVYIITMVSHASGKRKCIERLSAEATNNNKSIRFEMLEKQLYYNYKSYPNLSTVLWPSHIPPDIKDKNHLGGMDKYPLIFRDAQGAPPRKSPFSSEAGRQLLEDQFLRAGAKLRAACKDPKTMICPLGFSYFAPGFGALTVTYRNCPNNCPLALWWGTTNSGTEVQQNAPPGAWYPLFPRKINTWEFST